jgi:hypothetical protein
MQAGELVVERKGAASFDEEFLPMDYPLAKAAETYLRHGRMYGISSSAKRLLTNLMKGIKMSETTEEKVTETPKKAAKAKKTVAAKGKKAVKKAAPAQGRPSTIEGQTFKVGSDESVKRGFLREYVDFALEQKKFTRADLVKKFKNKVGEDRATRYFGYCTTNQIFVEA